MRCEGAAVQAWAERACRDAGCGATDGGGHSRRLRGGILWCNACGAYAELRAIGLGEPVPISAEHGEGMGDLRDAMVEALGRAAFRPEKQPRRDRHDGLEADDATGAADGAAEAGDIDPSVEEVLETYDPTKPLRLAIVGRPNAGKSTLINRFLGEDRLLTGPEAGITRDSISVEWEWRGRTIKVFDTAGMRRKARIRIRRSKCPR